MTPAQPTPIVPHGPTTSASEGLHATAGERALIGFWLGRRGIALLGAGVFAAGVLLALVGGNWQARDNHAHIAARLTEALQGKRAQIEARLQLYHYGLRGTRGAVLVAGAAALDEPAFQRYAASRDIALEFPGARGFGFIRRVRQADHAGFVAAAGRDNAGFAATELGPHTGDHYIIEYIEPLARNRQAKGLDIGSEPRRRAAADRAARTATVTLTGPITLVQASGAAQQGALLLLPVYREPLAPATDLARMEQVVGWSYAPLVYPEMMADLMQGERIGWQLSDLGPDTPAEEPPQVLFRSTSWSPPQAAAAQVREHFPLFGRRWVLAAQATPAFVDALALPSPAHTIAGGMVLALAVALLASAGLTLRRRRVQVLARDLQLDWLSQVEAERSRLGAVLDGTAAGTWEWQVQTGETRFNARWAAIIGYTLEELAPTSITTWLTHAHPDDLTRSAEALERHFSGATPYYECEARMRHKSGHWVWVLDRGTVQSWTADGKPAWMFGVHLDISERKRQELALRESEALLAQTGEVAMVGGWALDVVGGSLRWTRQTRRILGLADDVVPSVDAAIDVFAAEARPLLRAAIADALQHARGWDLELPLRRSDGTPLWVRSTGHAVVDAGKVVTLIGGLQDVTEAHRRRLELQEAHQRLEAATQVAGIGIWDLEPSTGRHYLSQQLYALHGHDPATPGPGFEQWAARMHPADRARIDATLQRFLAAPGPTRSEYRVLWPDGSIRLIEALGQRVTGSDGAPTRIVGVCRDITDERAAREAIRAVRDRLALATSVGRIGVWEWDVASDAMAWDAQMFALYGVPDGTPATYALWRQRVHPVDLAEAETALRHSVANPGHACDVEFRIVRGDGSLRTIKAAATVAHDETGHARKLIGVNVDITEQRHAQLALSMANLALEERVRERTRELEEAKEAAEQANLAKSEFLANMSHELRTPLHGILGFAKLIQDDVVDTDGSGHLGRFCGRIVRNGEQLLALVNDLLDTARIEAGRLRIELHRANLAGLVRQVVAEFVDGDEATARVRYAGPERLDVDCDAQRLAQVVRNLVANALKFAPAGTPVEVQLDEDSATGAVQLRVADRGPGVPEGEFETIFDRFTQSSRTKSGAGGSGLGLTIARGIMVQHGGSLGARNREGGGACFIATLPLPSQNDALPDKDRHPRPVD